MHAVIVLEALTGAARVIRSARLLAAGTPGTDEAVVSHLEALVWWTAPVGWTTVHLAALTCWGNGAIAVDADHAVAANLPWSAGNGRRTGTLVGLAGLAGGALQAIVAPSPADAESVYAALRGDAISGPGAVPAALAGAFNADLWHGAVAVVLAETAAGT